LGGGRHGEKVNKRVKRRVYEKDGVVKAFGSPLREGTLEPNEM